MQAPVIPTAFGPPNNLEFISNLAQVLVHSLRAYYLDLNACLRSVLPQDLGAYSVCPKSENICDLQNPILDFPNSKINNHPARPIASGVTGLIDD